MSDPNNPTGGSGYGQGGPDEGAQGPGGYEQQGGYGSGGYDQGGYEPPPPPAGYGGHYGGHHGDPPAGQYGGQPGGQYGGQPGGRPAPSPRSFFGALFDFSFNTFVTPMIVKAVYILITVAIALGLLIFVIVGFADSVGAGIVVLLLGWIPALLYLAFFRMTLEFYYSVVRMSQDINRRLPG